MTQTHADYRLNQLDELEAESIHIFREVAAEFEKPVLMFSGGKDSIVMMRLAEKARAKERVYSHYDDFGRWDAKNQRPELWNLYNGRIQDIDAMICWMTNEPLRPRQKLAIKHTTPTGRALIKVTQYRLDVNTLHRDQETKALRRDEGTRPQQDRPCPAADHRVASVRPVLQEPHHGLFHPLRRSHGSHLGAGMIKRELTCRHSR
jgi:hypothetical protein